MVVDVVIRLVFGLPTEVVSSEQEGLRPLNRATEYVEVPPDQVTVAVTVADWPESMTGGVRVRPAERGGLTVNWEVDDSTVTGMSELSVTFVQ
jgi:hypothetical protein